MRHPASTQQRTWASKSRALWKPKPLQTFLVACSMRVSFANYTNAVTHCDGPGWLPARYHPPPTSPFRPSPPGQHPPNNYHPRARTSSIFSTLASDNPLMSSCRRRVSGWVIRGECS